MRHYFKHTSVITIATLGLVSCLGIGMGDPDSSEETRQDAAGQSASNPEETDPTSNPSEPSSSPSAEPVDDDPTAPPPPVAPGSSGKSVILKLDDLRHTKTTQGEGISPGWLATLNYLDSVGVVAGIGIIAEDSQGTLSSSHVSFIQGLVERGHELWHHGWDHDRGDAGGEFCNRDADYQSSHFHDTLNLVETQYGIRMTTFGAPYNCTDATFTEVIEDQSDIDVVMFTDPPHPANALHLPQTVKIEESTGVPDYDYFLNQYQAYASVDLYVLQAHPNKWFEGSAELEAFKRIIEFLQNEGHAFTTAHAHVEQTP